MLKNRKLTSLWYEPTDVKKASKPFETEAWKCLKFFSPNFNELKVMAKATGFRVNPNSSVTETLLDPLLNEVSSLCQHLVKYGNTAVVTLGNRGVMIVRSGQPDEPFYRNGKFLSNTSANISARYYPVNAINSFANVSGAGDCFASGFITAMLRGETESECVHSGSTASLQALHSISAVPSKMSPHCQTSATFLAVR